MASTWSVGEIARAYAIGSQEWRALDVPLAQFAEFLRVRPLAADVSDLHLQDLYLACACSTNVRNALACFRQQYFAVTAAAVRSFDASPHFAEEMYQLLSEALFVRSPSGGHKIEQYTGQGRLAGFVRTAARRLALRQSRNSAKFQGEEALLNEFAQFDELETMIFKLQCERVFSDALRVALRSLPRRERLVLRMNLVEKVSTTRIAAMYKVSQPTISRWIQRSSRTIFETVKDLVCDELQIETNELGSLLSLVRSQIEITISRGSTLDLPAHVRYPAT